MDNSLINSLECELSFCQALSQVAKEGARSLLNLLRKSGTSFHYETGEEDGDPYVLIKSNGDIIVPLPIAHSLLFPEKRTRNIQGKGTGSVGYVQDQRLFAVSQSASFPDERRVDELARGIMNYARLIIPQLSPKYGWIDKAGENTPSGSSINRTEIKMLFWANFFGPEYVERFNRKVFLDAPAWKKEELDNGGLLLVSNESFVEWHKSTGGELLEYFQKEIDPNIKKYRSKGVHLGTI